VCRLEVSLEGRAGKPSFYPVGWEPWIASGIVNQDEPCDRFWVAVCVADGVGYSYREARETEMVQLERVDDRLDIGHVMVEGVFYLRRVALTATSKVDADASPWRESAHLPEEAFG
jgi:hypothetical protein